LLDYVMAVLSRGGGWVDAVLFVHAWRCASPILARRDALAGPDPLTPADTLTCADALASADALTRVDALAGANALADAARAADLDTLTQLASAFRGSAETALESRQQGGAFLDVTRKAWPHPILEAFATRQAQSGTPVAHCIAVAVACAAHEVALAPALHSYIHAVAANLVSAGARLIPLGQTQAQIAIAQLSPAITEIAERAQATSLDDLGTAAPAIELCSLRHETQYTRLFRS
jgi:urease accessory protein